MERFISLVLSMNNSQENLTLILPTLNEQGNIVAQIRGLFDALPALKGILVVDDNSSDKTLYQIQSCIPEELKAGHIKTLPHTSRVGLAMSLYEAVQAVETPLVGWLDCDLSMPPHLITSMLEKLDAGYDVCIGSRFLPEGSQKRFVPGGRDSRAAGLLSTLLNKAITKFLRAPLTDLTSGFIVGNTATLREGDWKGYHGEYFIYLMFSLLDQGKRLTEIPYVCGNRSWGHSKTFSTGRTTLENGARYLRAVVAVSSRKTR